MTVRSRLDGANNMMCNDKKKRQGGFTLIEVIIAILILAMAIVGFVPLYSYVHSNLIMNRTRLVAFNLAKNRIEAIKSMRWGDIGTHTWQTDESGNFILDASGYFIRVNCSPNGPFLLYRNVTSDGSPISQSDCEQDETPTGNSDPISYKITTRIGWLADESKDQFTTVPTDYKKIIVTVDATNGVKTLQSITLDAKVTLEGEPQALPGGHIIVAAQKGWNSDYNNPIPVGGITINLTGPDGTLWTGTTDESGYQMPGEAFFAALTPLGIYTMNAQDSNGMMVLPGSGRPGMANQSAAVVDTGTAYMKIYVEKPCYLKLNFKDGVTGQPVDLNNTEVYLLWPSLVMTPNPYVADGKYTVTGSSVDQSVFGKLWPVGAGCAGTYTLKVQFYNMYPPYNDYDNLKARDWDGTFNEEELGKIKTVTLNLVPCPKVTVCSGGMPISSNTAIVTIQLFRDTYSYSASSGTWSVLEQGTTPIETSYMETYFKEDGTIGTRVVSMTEFSNNSNGDIVFPNLPDNEAAPDTPDDGDTCDIYRIVVNAPAGYQAPSNVYTFWVKDGYMMYCDQNGQKKPPTKVAINTEIRGPIFIDLPPDLTPAP